MCQQVKNKIEKIIKSTNGLPNFTQREYLRYIRIFLLDQFSDNEMEMIRSKKIDLDEWVMEITREITEDLF